MIQISKKILKIGIQVIAMILLLVACNYSEKQNPNILFIVVDDMGYADFTPFNKNKSSVSIPNLTKLANSGMIFTQAYVTSPVCSPSRVGMLTGKNQFRWDKKSSWGPGLPDNVKTLAEYLSEAGYKTGMIGKSDLGTNFHKYDAREYPLKHGYEEFLGFSAHAHDYWLLSKEIQQKTPDPSGTSAVLGPLMHNMGQKSYSKGYTTEIFTDEAIQFMKHRSEKPFFLMLSYNALHHLIHEVPQKYLDKYEAMPITNYDPDSMVTFGEHLPGSYAAYYDKYSRLGDIDDDNLRKFYLANLDCLDDNIGRVLNFLEEDGLKDNTVVIFISDNGGSPLNGANNAPLTGGKYSLWEGGIRVPLAISWPGKVEAGKIQQAPVSSLDILPTIAHELGIQLKDSCLDGRNLLQADPERLLVWKWQKSWAVRKGDWKLTNSNENHWKSRPSNLYIKPIKNDYSLKLFNLKEDVGERNNLAEEYPEKLQELLSEYSNWNDKNVGVY